ncbi:MAG: hypothetical protein ACRBB0_21975 [Pelagimonas sp.]|uniref:hypothetical protein n=1 Tax=Pelagimonas sp. TaxID=2073170 RepID=UPI003D6C2E4D
MTSVLISVFSGFIVVLAVLRWREKRRKERRWQSLRSLPGGLWIWTEHDGTEMRSDIHPQRPGGAWFNEGGWFGYKGVVDHSALRGMDNSH